MNNKMDSFKISPLLKGQMVVLGKKIYISAMNYNGLFEVDIASGIMTFIGKFSGQGNLDVSLFRIGKKDKILIFAPIWAEEIAFYDIGKSELREISMKEVFSTFEIVISTFAVCDEYLYLFPAKADSIIVYNMNENRISDVLNVSKAYESLFERKYTELSATDSHYIYEDKIYVSCWGVPAFVSLDIKERNLEFYKIEDYNEGFCALCGQGERIYAFFRNGMLIEWNIKQKTVTNKMEVSECCKNSNYRIMTIYGDYIYLFLQQDFSKTLRVDLKLQSVKEGMPQKITEELKRECAYEKIYFGCIDEERIYCYTNQNRFLCMDMENERVEWIKDVIFHPAELGNIIFDETGTSKRSGTLQETEAVTVRDLIRRPDFFSRTVDINKTNIGERIYESLKK